MAIPKLFFLFPLYRAAYQFSYALTFFQLARLFLMAHPLQLGLQDAASPIMEELTRFHDHALIIVILVSAFVLYLIIITVSTNLTNLYTLDSQNIEIV